MAGRCADPGLMSALLLATALALADPVPEAWLDAVAQIESNGRPGAVGDRGAARGEFQFHKEAWADCSKIRRKAKLPIYPYSAATDRAKAREYARTWLTWIQAELSARIGRKALAHETWLAFNLGMSGFAKIGYQACLAEEPRYVKAMKVYVIIYAPKNPRK